MDTENVLSQEIINNLNNAQTQIILMFSDDIDKLAIGNFQLYSAFAGNPYTIKFRYEVASYSPSVQKIIIFHELLHLNIYAKLYGASSGTINIVVPGYQDCYQLWGSNQNELHHEYFARNYLQNIKSFIQTAAPGLDADKAKWSSLLNTMEFKNLGENEQESIIKDLIENKLY